MEEIRRINAHKENLYAILCVDRNAAPEEINASYRRLAKLIHPDKNSHPEATATFKILNDAYSTLKNPFKRREYNINQLYKNRRIFDEVDYPQRNFRHKSKDYTVYKDETEQRESEEKPRDNEEEQWEQWEETFREDAWYWDEPWDENLEADVYWEWFVGLPWDQTFEEYMYWGGNWNWEEELMSDETGDTNNNDYKSKSLCLISGFVMGVLIGRFHTHLLAPFEVLKTTSREIPIIELNYRALGAVSALGVLVAVSPRCRNILNSYVKKATQLLQRLIRI